MVTSHEVPKVVVVVDEKDDVDDVGEVRSPLLPTAR